jgi:hypothetical protein
MCFFVRQQIEALRPCNSCSMPSEAVAMPGRKSQSNTADHKSPALVRQEPEQSPQQLVALPVTAAQQIHLSFRPRNLHVNPKFSTARLALSTRPPRKSRAVRSTCSRLRPRSIPGNISGRRLLCWANRLDCPKLARTSRLRNLAAIHQRGFYATNEGANGWQR